MDWGNLFLVFVVLIGVVSVVIIVHDDPKERD